MSIFSKLQAWWRNDSLETAEAETHMTQEDRDKAERDYRLQGRTAMKSGRMGMGSADYERDSEPPPR